MKKRAIRALIALSMVVALCMFFSGTIKTLTTAKVKIVVPKNGRLEEKIALKGELTFPETCDIKPYLENGESLIITRVVTTKGQRVTKGDPLFEAEVANYESLRAELNTEYETAQKAYLDLERKNSNIHLRRSEENWIEAYDTLAECGQVLMQAQLDLQVKADLAGISLVDGQLPKGTEDAALSEAEQKAKDAHKAQQAAQSKFDEANRLGINDEVVEYISQNRSLTARMEKTQAALTRLEVLRQQIAVIAAPHDGDMVAVNVKVGDPYNGTTALATMSAEAQCPVLRADVDELERVIETETEVEVARGNGKNLEKLVTATGMNSVGKAIIDVTLDDMDVTALGGCATLLEKQADMTIAYKATVSTTLLPSAAVRGTGNDRYVYLINEEWSNVGKTVLKTEKLKVRVLAENDTTASVEEDLSNSRVAYMEDRAISEGSEVMAYGQ